MADKKQNQASAIAPDLDQFKKQYTVKDKKDGKYTFEVTINSDAFQKSYDKMLQQNTKDVNIKGFRAGKVPTQSVEQHFKNDVMQETFQRLANIYVLSAIYAENLHPIIPAKISEMPKIILGTDIKFKFEVVTQQDFKLADPKKIKVEKDDPEVTDEEVQETLENLDKQLKAQEEAVKSASDKTKKSSSDESKDTSTKSNKDDKKKSAKETKKTEFNDKWAKETAEKMQLPDVKSLDDLKKLIKEQLKTQKERVVEQKYQKEVLSQAVEKSNINVPEEALEYEAHHREHAFMDQLEKSNMKLEKWLETYSTKLEDLQKAWKEDSEQALKEDAFLTKYAEVNEIEVKDSEIDKMEEVYKKQQENFEPTEQWRAYMQSVLMKQKAFEDLLKKVENSNKK